MQNQTPNTSPVPPMGNMGGEEKSTGALIGSIIIIIVLILGGLYLWNAKMQEQEMDMIMEGMSEEEMMMDDDEIIGAGEEDAAAAALSEQGTSDETSAIEADLNATNYNEMDADLNDL